MSRVEHYIHEKISYKKTGGILDVAYLIMVVLTCVLFINDTAFAHARWKLDGTTPPRDNNTGHKIEPCGNVPRTNKDKTFTSGATIEVEWEETINHPGYFQIFFTKLWASNCC